MTIAPSAFAGPLGLEMGTSLNELQAIAKLKPEESYSYSTTSLPNGHPDFNDYRLVITPKHGLCKVSAWSQTISTSVYGTELLSTFDRYFEALTNKYGTGKRYDFLKAGSIWKESRDWMMSLVKKERSLAAFWTEKDLQLPDNIHGIRLQAYAFTTNAGLISIGYEFKNANDCMDWIKAQKDSKL